MSFGRKLLRKKEQERGKYYDDVKGEATKIANRALDRAVKDAYDEAYAEASETAIVKVLAVAAEIIYNDWNKLRTKDTRLKAFVELMNTKLQSIDTPSEAQMAVEQLLDEQCGLRIARMEETK